jgi:hypothetical protein
LNVTLAVKDKGAYTVRQPRGIMKEMSNILYSDSGSPFEGASMLRNTVYFSTAQRANSAQLILQQPLGVSQQQLAFLVLRAFQEFMTSTEDMVGWLFVLQEWQPGNAEFSLFLLLDRIKVGYMNDRKGIDYTETRAASLLKELDEDGFRNLIHIPNDADLLNSGMSKELVDGIKLSIPAKLDGWRRITNKRVEQDRGLVCAFNKVKHHMLAFPTQEHNKDEVWLPSRIRFNKVKNRVDLERAWLNINADQVKRLAADSIAAQAVLHNTLALILVTRYGEKYTDPHWVRRAFESEYLWRR